MRLSIYNTFLHPDDRHTVVYNALSDKFLALKGYLTPGDLDIQDNEVRDNLIAIGALVDDNADECGSLRDLIRECDHGDTHFQLHVNPTLDCNFRCHYCYEEHRAGSRMEESTIEAVKRLIENKLDTMPHLRHFSLSFFGGEPLMSFHNVVRPLVEFLQEKSGEKGTDYGIHLTSNAFLLNDAMIDFFSRHKASFQITLDGHRELHDKVRFKADGSGSYDKILENIRKLTEGGCPVLVRINFTAAKLHSIPALIEDFRDMPEKGLLRFDLQRVWQDRDNGDEDEIDAILSDYMRMFHESGFSVNSHFSHDLVRDSCYGDKRQYALVNYDGYVFRCTARDFTEKNRAGVLREDGSIEWFNNQLECRLAAKFAKRVCHTCRIAPICGGGCCQQAIEHTDPDTCMYGYTDEDLDRFIARRFEFYHVLGKTLKSAAL